jgi:hypothetical protein
MKLRLCLCESARDRGVGRATSCGAASGAVAASGAELWLDGSAGAWGAAGGAELRRGGSARGAIAAGGASRRSARRTERRRSGSARQCERDTTSCGSAARCAGRDPVPVGDSDARAEPRLWPHSAHSRRGRGRGSAQLSSHTALVGRTRPTAAAVGHGSARGGGRLHRARPPAPQSRSRRVAAVVARASRESPTDTAAARPRRRRSAIRRCIDR